MAQFFRHLERKKKEKKTNEFSLLERMRKGGDVHSFRSMSLGTRNKGEQDEVGKERKKVFFLYYNFPDWELLFLLQRRKKE